MLAAGIDVFSTVNVQHLESLNDRVAELTGTRVRETVPDSVIARRRRDRPRRPHARGADRAACRPARSIRRSGSRPRSTTSSGSRTCRRCARSRCARWPRRSRPSAASPRSPPSSSRSARARTARARHPGHPGDPGAAARAGHPRPASQRVVRRAARSAQRLDGELDLLYVRDPGREPNATEREQLEALRRLASMLGAHLLVEEGDDVARDRRPGRARARHHLRADGHPARAARPAPPRRAAARPAAEAAAGRRPQDRRGSR